MISDKIFVTGAAGFVGFHFISRLLADGHRVLGIDNLNDYYPVSLKLDRLSQLKKHSKFEFIQMDLNDSDLKTKLTEFSPKYVVNLAAQAGVRYSLKNPLAYVNSNIAGFVNLLEAVRGLELEHFIYASSSSVYGNNTKVPFSTSDTTDQPASLYAATKKSNELIVHAYAHLYKIPCTGLRFFTVYGSWGRPDMAYFNFTEKIKRGEVIDLYNFGKMKRDFTHISDIVEAIVRLLDKAPPTNFGVISPQLYNIGASSPVELVEFVKTLEDLLGIQAKTQFLPMQPGDVPATFADVSALESRVGYSPKVTLRVGLAEFVRWHNDYYSKK